MQPYNADYRLNIGFEIVSIETWAEKSLIAATAGLSVWRFALVGDANEVRQNNWRTE